MTREEISKLTRYLKQINPAGDSYEYSPNPLPNRQKFVTIIRTEKPRGIKHHLSVSNGRDRLISQIGTMKAIIAAAEKFLEDSKEG
jgi:hypothetical protein